MKPLVSDKDDLIRVLVVVILCLFPFAYIACFPTHRDPRLQPEDFQSDIEPHPLDR